MKPLSELIVDEEPAIDLINSWVKDASNNVRILPPSEDRGKILFKTQVTTHSVLGAVVYETGGILINNGWLRFIGSGHPDLQRVLPEWNDEFKNEGIYLVADDAAGGFFAVNGGTFEGDVGKIYYWPPDSFEWEEMDMQFSDFLHWSMVGDLNKFYDGIMWDGWQNEVGDAGADKCINFYPPLWSKEGNCEKSMRTAVPAKEALDVRIEWIAQLNDKT